MATKAKKKTAPALRPIKEKMTKSAIVTLIAERNELTRQQVSDVLASLEEVIHASIHPNGLGEFTLPGLLKVYLRKVPARKAGTLIRNPATGEMMKAAAKPASVRVKLRALAKLKDAAAG